MMTPKHEAHLAHLLSEGEQMLRARYPRGVEKYGTYLPDMPHLVDEALEEVLDAFTYLITARDQHRQLVAECNRLRAERALTLSKLTKAIAAKDWHAVAEATMSVVDGQLNEAKPVRF